MVRVIVTYDVQQPERAIEVSEETAKYINSRIDGNYSYEEGTKEKAVEDMVSKLREFHPGQRIEIVDIRRV